MKIDDSFEKDITELKKMYEKNPKKVSKKLKRLLLELKVNQISILKNIDFETLSVAVNIVVIALIGLININGYGLYLAGIAFFLAGFFIGCQESKFGLIFLFSHGCTGFGLMVASQISSIIDNPILNDNPKNIYIYGGISIFIAVAGLLLTVFYNLSDEFKKINLIKAKILLLFTISIFLLSLLPHIIRPLYSFHF